MMATRAKELDINKRNIKKIDIENAPFNKQIGVPNRNILMKKSESMRIADVPRRPVLGEIKNNISNRETTLKRSTTLAPAAKVSTFRKPAVSAQDVKKKDVNVTKVATVCLKREESIIKNVTVTVKNKVKAVETKSVCDGQIEAEKSEPKSYSTQILEEVDVDEEGEVEEGGDPQLVPEYIGDIFRYMRELEVRYPVREAFLKDHKTTPRMRAILMNWLVEVHLNFKMLQETLQLCVAIVDRYLQRVRTVGKHNLQLVGVTALLIASKYEEVYVENLEDFVYVCDDSFCQQQILQMELSILKTLDFSLGRPLPLHFLRRYSKLARATSQHHALAKYVLELGLLEYELAHVAPSQLAAAASLLAAAVLERRAAPPAGLLRHCGYGPEQLRPVLRALAATVLRADASRTQAVRAKYATAPHLKVSLRPELRGPVLARLAQD